MRLSRTDLADVFIDRLFEIETKKLEDRSLDDLINKTYQDLLIKLISSL